MLLYSESFIVKDNELNLMSSFQSEILSLSNKFREEPTHNSGELNKLIQYLQSDDLEVCLPAAMRLSALSQDYPEPICANTDEIVTIFKSSEDVRLRLELAKLFKNLSEYGDCMNESVVRGLTEAIKIRSNMHWEVDASKEETVIKHGIVGLTAILDKSNQEISRDVVESITKAMPVFDRRTTIRAIKLFEAVCKSEGEGRDLAFQSLIQMANSNNINVSLRAMEALARL